MAFHRPKRKFPIDLIPATPTSVTEYALQAQLANVGLDCSRLDADTVAKYAAAVRAQLPKPQEGLQSFGICTFDDSLAVPTGEARSRVSSDMLSIDAAVPKMVPIATGHWKSREPSNRALYAVEVNRGALGCETYLARIVHSKHFDWLYDNRESIGFMGQKNDQPAETQVCDNAEAIMRLFVKTARNVSSVLVKGLDAAAMEAMMANLIEGMNDANIKDYSMEKPKDVVVFLVDDYDVNNEVAEAVGALFLKWKLFIENYKDSGTDNPNKHKTEIKIEVGAVLYREQRILCRDYEAVIKHFGYEADKCELESQE